MFAFDVMIGTNVVKQRAADKICYSATKSTSIVPYRCAEQRRQVQPQSLIPRNMPFCTITPFISMLVPMESFVIDCGTMDLVDVEMEDSPGPFLALPEITLEHDEVMHSPEEELRSPRTPVFMPEFSASPFDHTKIFSPSPNSPTKPKKRNSLQTPPANPLTWVWQCHLCKSRYALGVTRRCLVDGHYYCSGENDQRNLKKKKRGQACSSEFDYVGWRQWGEWKRKALKTMENPSIPKGCEKCEFPSQCRYTETATLEDHPSTSVFGAANLKVDTSLAEREEADAANFTEQKQEADIEPMLKQALAADKSPTSPKQMKLTDFFRSEKDKDDGDTGSPRSGISTKAKKRKSKTCLSPIDEQGGSDSDSISDLQNLIMPVLGMLSSKSTETGKSQHKWTV